METLGQRIKKFRIELNLSQEELATRLGYKSRSSINKIELGLNDISQSKVYEIANVLGVSPSILLGLDKEMELTEKCKIDITYGTTFPDAGSGLVYDISENQLSELISFLDNLVGGPSYYKAFVYNSEVKVKTGKEKNR